MATPDTPNDSGWGKGHGRQLRALDDMIGSGEARQTITCEEARREWFVMAREQYVNNNPEPRAPIDYEVGLHIGGCVTTECQVLVGAYWTILRPSQPRRADLLAAALDELETRIKATDN